MSKNNVGAILELLVPPLNVFSTKFNFILLVIRWLQSCYLIPLPLEFYFIAVPLEKIYVVGSYVGDFGDGSKSCFWHQASTPHRHFWGLGTFQLKFRQHTVCRCVGRSVVHRQFQIWSTVFCTKKKFFTNIICVWQLLVESVTIEENSPLGQ